MGPTQSATSGAGRLSKKQREAMTLQEKVEMLCMYYRLRTAAAFVHHIKRNESSVRIIAREEKETCEAVTAAIPAGSRKTLHFCEIYFYLILKMHLLFGYRIIIKKALIDFNKSEEKVKSLYENFKQKER